MARKRPGPEAECECCKCIYRKDPRNARSQRYCTRPDCVRIRKRLRQNASYKAKYRNDKEFQQSERARCGKSLKLRREAARQLAAAHPPRQPWNWELVVLGIIRCLTDAGDPTAAEASLRHFERTGQPLAATTPLGRGASRARAG